MLRTLYRGDKVVQRHSRHRHHLHGTSGSQLYRQPSNRSSIRSLYNVDKVIGTENRILSDHGNSHGFNFLIHLSDSLWPLFDSFSPFICQVGQKHIKCHGSSCHISSETKAGESSVWVRLVAGASTTLPPHFTPTS